jgi:hypothetical protein
MDWISTAQEKENWRRVAEPLVASEVGLSSVGPVSGIEVCSVRSCLRLGRVHIAEDSNLFLHYRIAKQNMLKK